MKKYNIKINSKLRKIIYNVYRGKCQYCVNNNKIPIENIHIDHVIPNNVEINNQLLYLMENIGLNPNNLNNLLNYTLACRVHNIKKSNKLLNLAAIGFLLEITRQNAPLILKKYQMLKSVKANKIKKLSKKATKKSKKTLNLVKREIFVKDVGKIYYYPEQLNHFDIILLKKILNSSYFIKEFCFTEVKHTTKVSLCRLIKILELKESSQLIVNSIHRIWLFFIRGVNIQMLTNLISSIKTYDHNDKITAVFEFKKINKIEKIVFKKVMEDIKTQKSLD